MSSSEKLSTSDNSDHSGQFHATDEPVDLGVYHWEDWLTFVVFWLLAITVFYQFFTRYVLSDFLGASMAVCRNTHIHVEFIYRLVPPKVGRSLSTFVDLVRIAFLAYTSWVSYSLVPRMHNLNMTVIDFPMSYVYGFVTFGFVMMTFRSVQVAIRHQRQGWSSLERPGEIEN